MQSSNHRIPRWYAGFTFFYIGNIYCSWWWLWRCRWEWQWFKDISVTILISCDLEVAGAAAGVLASVDVSQKNDEQKKHRGKNWETTQSKIKRPILSLYLYADIYWQFTAGSISAIQLSIWKVRISREDDTDYIHLPQFVYQPWFRFAHRRHDPNHVHVSMSYHSIIKVKGPRSTLTHVA